MDESSGVVAHELLKVVPLLMGTIRVEMRSRRGANLTVMQFRALVYLDLNPGASLSAVAEHLGLTLPTVSAMIDGMVENGMVHRAECATDRRRVELSLTPRGENLLAKAINGTEKRLEEIISSLNPQERETVFEVMQLLQRLFTPETTRQPSLEK
jgi:DNA-binding MarR family transcriptional regulator